MHGNDDDNVSFFVSITNPLSLLLLLHLLFFLFSFFPAKKLCLGYHELMLEVMLEEEKLTMKGAAFGRDEVALFFGGNEEVSSGRTSSDKSDDLGAIKRRRGRALNERPTCTILEPVRRHFPQRMEARFEMESNRQVCLQKWRIMVPP